MRRTADGSPLYTTRKPGIYPSWWSWLPIVGLALFSLACAGLLGLMIFRAYGAIPW